MTYEQAVNEYPIGKRVKLLARPEYSHPDVQAGDEGVVTYVGVLSPFTMTPCLTVQLDRGFNVYPLVDDLEA